MTGCRQYGVTASVPEIRDSPLLEVWSLLNVPCLQTSGLEGSFRCAGGIERAPDFFENVSRRLRSRVLRAQIECEKGLARRRDLSALVGTE